MNTGTQKCDRIPLSLHRIVHKGLLILSFKQKPTCLMVLPKKGGLMVYFILFVELKTATLMCYKNILLFPLKMVSN